MIELTSLQLRPHENVKRITFPQTLTKELAEDIGWQIGDGCISAKNSHYLFKLAGDPREEKEFYDNVVSPTKTRLFNFPFKPKIVSDKNSYGIEMRNKALVYFYHKIIGLPLAPKINITIPSIILDSEEEIIASCIRGIFDTDGGLFLRKKRREVHHYPSLQLESVSKQLILDVERSLKSMNINCCATYDKIRKPTAYGYVRTYNRICIEGKRKLDKWMDIIGFRNQKHVTKYHIWKGFGICPAGTTLEDRIKILQGKVDPYSFYRY